MMEILTPANQLTMLRLALVPVFALCMFYDRPGWALVAFAAAAITDMFDGLVARWFRGVDVRSQGSGNIGATNVARVAGKKLGVLVLVLDAYADAP